MRPGGGMWLNTLDRIRERIGGWDGEKTEKGEEIKKKGVRRVVNRLARK